MEVGACGRVYCVFQIVLSLFVLVVSAKFSAAYCEVLAQGKAKPKCCEKCEAKVNKDINRCSTLRENAKHPRDKN